MLDPQYWLKDSGSFFWIHTFYSGSFFWIHTFYTVYRSVPDPGCLSRIRLFSIPDPTFPIPDPRSASKNLSILTPNKWFPSSRKYARIRILTFYPSRIQGSKRHRILNDPVDRIVANRTENTRWFCFCFAERTSMICPNWSRRELRFISRKPTTMSTKLPSPPLLKLPWCFLCVCYELRRLRFLAVVEIAFYPPPPLTGADTVIMSLFLVLRQVEALPIIASRGVGAGG